MHFSLATLIIVVPLLASATPLAQSPRVTIPISKRINLRRQDGSVDIDALKASVSASTAKILRGFDVYQQNTGEHHPSQPDNYKRAIDEEALTDFDQDLWYGNISVGTPAVSFTVDFDTGSSDLFLPASSCGSTCSGHTTYNPSSSSTSKSLGKSFNLTYGDGSTVRGKQYTDTVKIAGLTVTKQTLGAATRYSSGFQSANFPADGLMGMGFQNISRYNAPPVFQNLVTECQTNSSVFAFELADSGSKLSIGGLDSSVYSGIPAYTNVTIPAYWQIVFDSLTVGGYSVLGSRPAIVDSGTTLVIGSTRSVKVLYEKIPGYKNASSTVGPGFYTFPCSINLPAIAFTIGGKSLPMSSSFNLGRAPNSTSDCVGSIVSVPDFPFWILGDAFMKNYYTIFDYGNSRVGFATLK